MRKAAERPMVVSREAIAVHMVVGCGFWGPWAVSPLLRDFRLSLSLLNGLVAQDRFPASE